MLFRRKQTTAETSPMMNGVGIVAHAEGGYLAAGRFPLPAHGPDELLIAVAYAGTNHADILQMRGQYAPPAGASALPGLEVSGTIAAIGSTVVGWSVGEPVCALLSGGGYAEYVAVPATQVMMQPSSLNLKQAASLPEAAATSVMALALEANLKKDERVLIHGGTSGLGILMTQIARVWGAEVFATVGNAEKAALLEKLGIHAINHRTAPFAEQLLAATNGEGVDVIIDILGGPQLATHLKLLRQGGRLLSLAMLEGPMVDTLKISGVLMKNLRWSGATLRNRSAAEKAAIVELVRKRVWPHISRGHILPVIDSVFPLADAEKALTRMQERLHMGKILLEVLPRTGAAN